MRFFHPSLFLALILAFSGVAEAAPLARVVAVVNGDMITSRELDKAAEPELLQKKLNPENPDDAVQIETLKRQVLEGMVNEKILMQEAQKLGITVSDEMIDQELERFIADSRLSREEFLRQMAQQGLTLETMRERLRSNIITQQLIGRMVVNKVVVTEEEIADYYRQHIGEVSTGQMRVALLIYPAEENADAWAARIASGSISFEDAVRQVSVGPSTEEGGDMGFISLSDLAPALREQVEGLQKGQVSEVFELQLNKAQVRLLDSAAPETASAELPDAETAARIEELLRAPRLDARFKEYTEQLRNRALVDIRY